MGKETDFQLELDFWNAEFFSQGALRFAQAAVWREWQDSRPVVLRGFDTPGSDNRIGAGHASVVSHFLDILAEAKLTSTRLHGAVRHLCETVSAWAQEQNAERGIKLGVQGVNASLLALQRIPTVEDLQAVSFVYLCEKNAYEMSVAALVKAAEPYSFAPDGPFRAALALFEKQRYWEGLNLCLTDMAMAMTVTAEPLSNEIAHQDQGRASEVVGGRWRGDPSKLLAFCDAALLREAYLTTQETINAGGDPFLLSHQATVMSANRLGIRADDATHRLQVADAIGPIPYSWRLDVDLRGESKEADLRTAQSVRQVPADETSASKNS